MTFRSIGEIAAELSAKALGNSQFSLKQNENTAMIKDEPEQRANAEPALNNRSWSRSRECL